ncbi:MAG: hypothetical protein PUD07_05960 [bacterium]|nr:hypothetical protein [bacterium]
MSRKNTNNNFYGSCGEFLVAASLSKRMLHVGLLTGNAGNIDLLVSTKYGKHPISIQVKASNICSRTRRINGTRVKGKYWLVGHCPTTVDKNLWYAFVDLKDENAPLKDTEIFFVPSEWVAAYTFVMKSTPYFFMSDELLDSDFCDIDSFVRYIEGHGGCPCVPAQMPWGGENEGMSTTKVLVGMKRWMKTKKGDENA